MNTERKNGTTLQGNENEMHGNGTDLFSNVNGLKCSALIWERVAPQKKKKTTTHHPWALRLPWKYRTCWKLQKHDWMVSTDLCNMLRRPDAEQTEMKKRDRKRESKSELGQVITNITTRSLTIYISMCTYLATNIRISDCILNPHPCRNTSSVHQFPTRKPYCDKMSG